MPRKPPRARRPAHGAESTSHDRQRLESSPAGTPAAVSDQPSTSIILPADLVAAIEKYNTTDWKDGRDPSKFGALNAVAYIGERTAAIVAATRSPSPEAADQLAPAVDLDARFTATEYVVDATYQENHNLWWQWAEHYGVPWDAESRGFHAQIGEVAGRPICVEVWWVLIDGVRIAFVDGTSALVDHALIEQWQHQVFPCRAHMRHADVANFGHVLTYVRSRTGRDPIRRDMKAVNAALRGLR